MNIGDEFQTTVEKTLFGGDGLAHAFGTTLFIPRTLPGETLIGRVTTVKKDFCRAEVVRFGTTSPERCEARCPLYHRCPGCCYGHVNREAEDRLKLDQLHELLRGAAFEVPAVELISPAPDLGYRNKLVFHVQELKGGKKHFGYRLPDGSAVDLENCPLGCAAIQELVAKCRCDRGVMSSFRDGMDVTFRYTDHDGAIFWRNRADERASWLREKLFFGELSVPRGSFFQVNSGGAEALARLAMETWRQSGTAGVVDWYAGVGLFGCAAAAAGAKQVSAVEADPAAAAALRYNLGKFGISPEAVTAGDTAELTGQLDAQPGPQLVFVDPPRSGLAPAVTRVLTAAPGVRQIVYVSCNPSTWVRDAGRLAKGGRTLKRLVLVNQFAGTEHFELFSLWE